MCSKIGNSPRSPLRPCLTRASCRSRTVGRDIGRQVGGRRAPAGVKMPRTAISRSSLRFSTMCTSRGVIRNAAAVRELLDRQRRGGTGRDRARSTRSRRRGGSATAPRPAGCSRRTSSRASSRCAGRRGPGTSGCRSPCPARPASIATMRSRAPMGACRSTSPPSVTRTSETRRLRRRARPARPRAATPPSRARRRRRRASPPPANANRSTSWPASPASTLSAGLEPQRLERELGAALRRDRAF